MSDSGKDPATSKEDDQSSHKTTPKQSPNKSTGNPLFFLVFTHFNLEKNLVSPYQILMCLK